MHPTFVEELAAQHLTELRQEAADWRTVREARKAAARDRSGRRWARTRAVLRRLRPAAA